MSESGYTSTTPKVIGVVPYTAFTASSTYYIKYLNSINRNAKQRTLLIYNSMNQPVNSPSLQMTDSALPNAGVANPISIMGSAIGIGQTAIETSENKGALASHCDSIQFSFAMGTTVPTSGNLTIYVVEKFD